MAKQKVITVNVSTAEIGDKGYMELELELINWHLDQGYSVKDKFTTVSNAPAIATVNITFILEKVEE